MDLLKGKKHELPIWMVLQLHVTETRQQTLKELVLPWPIQLLVELSRYLQIMYLKPAIFILYVCVYISYQCCWCIQRNTPACLFSSSIYRCWFSLLFCSLLLDLVLISTYIPYLFFVAFHFLRQPCFGSSMLVQNPGWLMIIRDYTTQYIGDYYNPRTGNPYKPPIMEW